MAVEINTVEAEEVGVTDRVNKITEGGKKDEEEGIINNSEQYLAYLSVSGSIGDGTMYQACCLQIDKP